MKNIILKYILILAILNPTLSAYANGTDTYTRVMDFVDNYQSKEVENSTSEDEEVAAVPSPTTFSEQLKAWEAEALSGTQVSNSKALLEISRGTMKDRTLEREADKIVEDIFRSLGGDSPAEFHAQLLDLFGTYVSSPMSREPLEMIFSRIDSYKFTPSDRNDIEKNRTFIGHLGEGTLYAVLAAAGYFMIAPAGQKKAIINAFNHPSAIGAKVSSLYKILVSKIQLWKSGLTAPPSIPLSRSLVVVQTPQVDNKTMIDNYLLSRFRQLYRRDPKVGEDILPFAERRNVVYNERVRVPSPEEELLAVQTAEQAEAEAVQAASREAAKLAVYSALNQVKLRLLGDYLKLTPIQTAGITAKFMGITLAGGSAYAEVARRYYNTNNSQYTIIPSDELTKFIRPLSILDLTCRAEQLQVEIKSLQQVTPETTVQNINALKDLIDNYRFLLRVASVYTNNISEALPVPKPNITSGGSSGVITFQKTYEGEDHVIKVNCPTRQNIETEVVTLLEAKPILENIRDILLTQEINSQLENLDAAKAAPIAKKILDMSAKSHNQIVTSLVAQTIAGNTAADLVLTELSKLMATADPAEIPDLGARKVPSEELRGKVRATPPQRPRG